MRSADILAQARALLLDFDGPVCSIFAGIPASVVADQLKQVLIDGGHTEMPESVAASADPFDVLRYADALGENEARYVEAAFTAHEVEAVLSAAPTEGAHDLIRAWRASSRPVAIVSNNSAPAINAYLDLYGLRASIDIVSARTKPDTALLKPSPYLLCQTIAALEVAPADCVFIGDSLSDIEAAHAADVRSIGFANKPGKSAKFAVADAVIETVVGLAAVS
ncbi:HAD family hydrolase [Amycolatopsis rifamycinica]|uniref:Haloacid dehalogenase n=1 Tax=Amycolatopsis rifamycinica TaxID=287986 RepID=A0A066U5Q0_9PSEU|nr:HAD family hydrolase [Amycolatopsis rifamycinica]KDN19459.1 haloacid dehalogenase [Amycolatopsis rifamycinica]